MDRAPVAHDEALEAPVVLQDLVEQIVVLAAPAAVDEIVGAHHRARRALLDRELEREQVGLAHRLRGDGHVERRAQRLLVVHRIMLDGRDDVVGLDAVDQRAGHRAGEQRVFADIFEVAAVPRLAREVHAARQHGVVAGRARFRADHRAARARRPPGSKLAAVASDEGRAVLGMKLLRTPIDASVWVWSGMPRRGTPGTKPAEPLTRCETT